MNTHDISIDETDDEIWSASCSCGWVGEDWEDPDDAQLDGEEHQNEA